MAFFGFDPSQNPRNRSHPTTAPGFSQVTNPFAGLAGGGGEDEEINFDDTYDGLGDELEEVGDELNDDTFGGASLGKTAGTKPVGRDFDFFGRTAEVSNAIEEEQLRYQRQQPPQKVVPRSEAASKPARTGYEKYQDPGFVADLQVDPALWGQAPAKPAIKQAAAQQPKEAPSRRMVTLEEIEAQMAADTNQRTQQQQQQHQQPQVLPRALPHSQSYHSQPAPQQYPHQGQHLDPRLYQQALSPQQQPQILHRGQKHSGHLPPVPQQQMQGMPGLIAGQMQGPRPGMPATAPPQSMPRHVRGDSRGVGQGSVVTHPQQLMNMSEQERAAFLAEDAKRAKRNHKIFLLSKDNGLMTPQDKNFITRIQLQQLMAATGDTDDKDTDAALSEDFYYQVVTSIRGGPRQNPNQPLSHFAQTYLFQTGGRPGRGSQRHGRPENHMQRMEQQVQRAVEAAKLKPKNKQLVLEGSLGKISFSNAKTPKPLLNLKRHESGDITKRPGSRQAGKELTGSDRKSILKNIEVVYSTLMKLEDEARKEPFLPPGSPPDEGFQQAHAEFEAVMQSISSKLWDELKVLEPINTGSSVPHPFIAFLSYAKGKKAIPRIFRHLSSEQRVTMLTMIVLHLDILDVISRGVLSPGESNLPVDARESIDLFTLTVTPSLFGYVSEAPLFTIIGLLGLILDRVNVTHVARTKVGLGILTMLTSRATLVKEAGEASSEADWNQWMNYYNRLFDTIEPILPAIFPPTASREDDVYVWQFLAAIGSGASPEQQQKLVIGVKDRVMESVQLSKTLPPELARQKRANVNLFMRAIGLDVDLLE